MSVPTIIKQRYALVRGSEVEGGLSSVYRASDLLDQGASVAVKLLGAPRIESELSLAFRREVGALRALDHPNIVRMLDSGLDETTSQYFVVLEWLPNRIDDVVARLRVDRGWDDYATELGLPILRALAYAHERGVVHRDVKPGNIMVTERGVPNSSTSASAAQATIDDDPRTLAGSVATRLRREEGHGNGLSVPFTRPPAPHRAFRSVRGKGRAPGVRGPTASRRPATVRPS